MEIPAAVPVERDLSHTPVELIAANCPHCEADTAIDPDKPLSRQRCHSCGLLLEEPKKRRSRMRKRSRVTPDGLLVKRSRERVWMPMAGVSLLVIVAAIFTLWMMHHPDAETAPPEETMPPDDGAAIRGLMEKWIAAPSPGALLPLIRDPANFEKPLRAWCAAHPGALPMGGEVGEAGEPREAFGVTLIQAAVAWPNAPAGFVLVAKTPAGWRVDWRAFAATGDLSAEDFLSTKPSSPVLLLMVARRTDYYNGAYADRQLWQCLHVTDSGGAHAFFAYAPRSNAALMKSLAVLPPAGRAGDLNPVPFSRRLALRLVFKSPESAALKQAEVTAVEGDGWFLP